MLCRCRTWTLVWLLAVSAIALASCSGASSNTRATEICESPENLSVGDHIRLTTTAGEMLELEIDSISSNALVGDGRRVAFAEIQRVEVISEARQGEVAGAPPTGVLLLISIGLGVLLGLIQLAAMD